MKWRFECRWGYDTVEWRLLTEAVDYEDIIYSCEDCQRRFPNVWADDRQRMNLMHFFCVGVLPTLVMPYKPHDWTDDAPDIWSWVPVYGDCGT